jgi:hypothetical protein
MPVQTEERWVHGNSLNIDWPEYLLYFRTGNDFLFYLFLGTGTKLHASIPAPAPTKGWRIKSLMLRHRISVPYSEFGIGGKLWSIIIYDAEHYLDGAMLINNSITYGEYQMIKVDLPEPKSYNYGLEVRVLAYYDYIYGAPWYTAYNIASVGVEFLRPN